VLNSGFSVKRTSRATSKRMHLGNTFYLKIKLFHYTPWRDFGAEEV
jgi:hypothetical protein